MTDRLPVPGLEGGEVVLRRSARARRLALRVGRADGTVTMTLPRGATLAEARAFVAQQAEWIARHVAAAPAPRRVAPGGTLPLLGREVPVRAVPRRGARWTGTEVELPEAGAAGAAARALLQRLARAEISGAVERHAAALGRRAGRITLRDTRSRWGSWSSRGDLMFSWRLVMAPPEVLDYVAAHEVAHLAHMDHSPRFWAQVEALMPDWRPRRDWLRREGAALHALRFD
jgi:predicted metal-dependent hydrolase